jgi:large subunit ribosomal protein L24
MASLKVGDNVVVMKGKNKGVKSQIIKVFPKLGLCLVKNVKVVKKHQKPNPAKGVSGGVVEKEMPIQMANLSLFNVSTGKSDKAIVLVGQDGARTRVYKSTRVVI